MPLLTVLLFAPALLQAQAQTQTRKDEPTRRKPSDTARPKRDDVPPPENGNPLVLKNPENDTGNTRDKYDDKGNRLPPRHAKRKDNGDYHETSGDPRAWKQDKSDQEELPLFGYSFFEPARQYIEAKRSYILGMYDPDALRKYQIEARRKALLKKQKMEEEARKKRRDKPKSNSPFERDEKTNRKKPPFDRDLEEQDPLPLRLHGKNGDRTGDDTQSDYPEDPRKLRPRGDRDSSEEDDSEDTGAAQRGSRSRKSASEENDRASIGEDDADDTDSETTPRPRSRRRPPVRAGDTQDDPAMDNIGQENDPESTDPENRLSGNANRSRSALNAARLRRQRGTQTDDLEDPALLDTHPGARPLSGKNNSPETATNRNSQRMRSEGLPSSVDAFGTIADPLTQLFSNVRASVPSSYALNAGDQLTVFYRTPTLTEREFSSEIDSLGNFDLNGNGRIVLNGMTLRQAQDAIQRRLSRIYKEAQVTVQLKELRTISVLVSGEAVMPGTYTVPAVATAINILYAAGGPTENGTLRNIEVRRQGKLVGSIDIYKFLTSGLQPDIPLQSGDMISVLPRRSHIAVKGEVLSPAMFEMKEGETLQDAIRYAGNIKPSGVSQSVQLTTLDPGRERVLKTLDLLNNAESGKVPLYDGDMVEVYSVRETLANKVTVEGAVGLPSDYALTPGMRVSDLVTRARGTIEEAYLPKADLYRWNPDNTTTLVRVDLEKALAKDPQADLMLTKWDRLKVYTLDEVAFTGYRKMEVRGAVVKEGVYNRSENYRISDLLRRAGGPAPDAYRERAVLLHQRGDGTFKYENINLDLALKGDPKHDVLIEDNDLLAVYSVKQANYTPEHVVTVRGEVVSPGIYLRGEGMKLSELIRHAGGFKPGAGSSVVLAHARRDLDARQSGTTTTVSVAFNRAGQCAPQDDILLEDGDVVAVQGDGSFQLDVKAITVKGAVNKPGPVILKNKNMRLSDAIREAGGLRPEGFPEGAEFFRDPKMLASLGQRTLVDTISKLSDLINESAYKRELAKSDIERLKAAGSAASTGVAIPGLGGSAPAVNPAGAVLAQQLGQHDLVTKGRVLKDTELEPRGNIAVNLPEALRKPNGGEDILLVDGDTITVPEKPTTVQVAGAVVNPTGVLHKLGAPLDYYITRAGGFAPDVARERIVVIRAGGGVIPANRVHDLRPGDLIFVPTKVLAQKLSNNQNGLDAVLRGLTNSALSVLLVTKLFGL